MKTAWASLLVLTFAEFIGISAISSAWGAAPGYCALYAREYARAGIGGALTKDAAPDGLSRLEDQAYYRCLNLDEEPALPSASIYYRPARDSEIAGALAALDPQLQAIATDEAAKAPLSLKIPSVAKPKPKRKPVHHARRRSTPAPDDVQPTTSDAGEALSTEKQPRFSVVRLLNRVGAVLQGSDNPESQRLSFTEADPVEKPTPPMAILPNLTGGKNNSSACLNSRYMLAKCN